MFGPFEMNCKEFACSENIDRQIGRVLKRLDSLGELENTYGIYTADHGMAIIDTACRKTEPLSAYRVPLIAKVWIQPQHTPPATSTCWMSSVRFVIWRTLSRR